MQMEQDAINLYSNNPAALAQLFNAFFPEDIMIDPDFERRTAGGVSFDLYLEKNITG